MFTLWIPGEEGDPVRLGKLCPPRTHSRIAVQFVVAPRPGRVLVEHEGEYVNPEASSLFVLELGDAARIAVRDMTPPKADEKHAEIASDDPSG
jgi:hypothetical protein